MKEKLIRPDEAEDAAIARGIASDPDAAPDLSAPVLGIVRRPDDDKPVPARAVESKRNVGPT